jgi:hypothetical protein
VSEKERERREREKESSNFLNHFMHSPRSAYPSTEWLAKEKEKDRERERKREMRSWSTVTLNKHNNKPTYIIDDPTMATKNCVMFVE